MHHINTKKDSNKKFKLKFFSDEKRYSICNFVKWFIEKFNDGFCFTKEDLAGVTTVNGNYCTAGIKK